MEEEKKSVTFRMQSKDEAGMKRVEKMQVDTRDRDTLRYIDKKMRDKGVQRMDRHPVDGRSITKLPKSGRGGKYTWEGSRGIIEDELDAAPAAIDEGDPNYVNEEEEQRIVKGEMEGVEGKAVGEVAVAKTAEAHDGVTTIQAHLPPV